MKNIVFIFLLLRVAFAQADSSTDSFVSVDQCQSEFCGMFQVNCSFYLGELLLQRRIPDTLRKSARQRKIV